MISRPKLDMGNNFWTVFQLIAFLAILKRKSSVDLQKVVILFKSKRLNHKNLNFNMKLVELLVMVFQALKFFRWKMMA